jgi:hypothetical protein
MPSRIQIRKIVDENPERENMATPQRGCLYRFLGFAFGVLLILALGFWGGKVGSILIGAIGFGIAGFFAPFGATGYNGSLLEGKGIWVVCGISSVIGLIIGISWGSISKEPLPGWTWVLACGGIGLLIVWLGDQVHRYRKPIESR